MKYLKITIIGLICTVFVSCNEGDNKDSKTLLDEPLIIDSLAILDEKNNPLGQPASFTFISENEFALVTKQGEVAIYNLNGEKKRSFKRVGSGPFEYLDPAYVKFYKDKLFIWCQQLLKIVVYDLTGNPLEEYTKFTHAIRDFEIVDNKVFFYRSGAAASPIIEVYDLASRELTAQVGINSEESALLTMIACVGGLNVVDDEVFFATPGELKLKYFNVNSPENVREAIITDADFRVEQLSYDKYQSIANDIGLRMDYVNKNSLIGGIYMANDMFVVNTEVGFYEYEDRWDGSSYNSSKRFKKYLLLDESMNLIRAYKGPVNTIGNCLIASNGKSLYTISAIKSSELESFVYQLNRIDLD